MKNTLLIIFISLISFACKRESPCGEPYESKSYNYYLADSNKANFPYTKIDTLVFVNQDWDTAVLVNSEGVKLYTERNGINGDNNPACPKWDYFYYEKMYTRFTGKNKNFNRIDVFMEPTQYGDIITFTINTKIQFLVDPGYYPPSRQTFSIIFRGKSIYGMPYSAYDKYNENKYPNSKIITIKNEGIIAWVVNDSNTYIKQ